MPNDGLDPDAQTVPLDNEFSPYDAEVAQSYLEMVQNRFARRPEVYNNFLDVMFDFKNGSIDIPGMVERVSTLFRGHYDLIQVFHGFLPAGDRVNSTKDTTEIKLTTVATPSGKAMHPVFSDSSIPSRVNVKDTQGQARQHPKVDFHNALSFINKIKERYQGDTGIYSRFSEILQLYNQDQADHDDLYRQVQALFKDGPDILVEFAQFLPTEEGFPGDEVADANLGENQSVEGMERQVLPLEHKKHRCGA